MSSLFNLEDLQLTSTRLPSREGCGACGLHKKCNSPKLKPSGLGEKKILIIGESPSKAEDERGEPMVGPPAQLLRKALSKSGINLDQDCRKINAIRCCLGSESPSPKFVEYCRPSVWKEIKEFQPKLILLLGVSALESFLGHRWQKGLDGIGKWRGFCIPDREVKAWVCPVFHPAYIQQQEKNPAIETVWFQDMKRALSYAQKSTPNYRDEKQCIEIIEGKQLYKYLVELSKSELSEIGIDYECTGLKPHREGHKIVSCAIAHSEDGCVAFDMPEDQRTLVQLVSILENPVVKKIAANIKYEHVWSKVRLNAEVRGWSWDTMQAAHILDNRSGICGLKFQAYINFGIIDYNSWISSFLEGIDDKDANSLNRIMEIPRTDRLYYNGRDSLIELRLANIQRRVMGYDYVG